MSGFGEITCNAGHVHKNERSADDCEQRRMERTAVLAAREANQINLVAPEFAEHGGSYFISRRRKASGKRA